MSNGTVPLSRLSLAQRGLERQVPRTWLIWAVGGSAVLLAQVVPFGIALVGVAMMYGLLSSLSDQSTTRRVRRPDFIRRHRAVAFGGLLLVLAAYVDSTLLGIDRDLLGTAYFEPVMWTTVGTLVLALGMTMVNESWSITRSFFGFAALAAVGVWSVNLAVTWPLMPPDNATVALRLGLVWVAAVMALMVAPFGGLDRRPKRLAAEVNCLPILAALTLVIGPVLMPAANGSGHDQTEFTYVVPSYVWLMAAIPSAVALALTGLFAPVTVGRLQRWAVTWRKGGRQLAGPCPVVLFAAVALLPAILVAGIASWPAWLTAYGFGSIGLFLQALNQRLDGRRFLRLPLPSSGHGGYNHLAWVPRPAPYRPLGAPLPR